MSRKKVSTTIYITSEQAERLKLLHERTKVPIAVYIREGIDLMLKHYEHMLPGQMSLEAAALSPAPPAVAPAPVAPRREPAREPATPLRSTREGGHDGSPDLPADTARPPPAAASKPSRSGES
jgi:predicted DNA-binding protein